MAYFNGPKANPSARWVMRQTYCCLDVDRPVRDFLVTRPTGEVAKVIAEDATEVLRAEPDAVDIEDRRSSIPPNWGKGKYVRV